MFIPSPNSYQIILIPLPIQLYSLFLKAQKKHKNEKQNKQTNEKKMVRHELPKQNKNK